MWLQKITLFILFALAADRSFAQGYVYIQSDKATPFYAKLNGVMQPRYSKYYSIITTQAAGKQQIEILFQQNMYAPVTFSLTVAEHAGQGYFLVRQNDKFILKDIDAGTELAADKRDK